MDGKLIAEREFYHLDTRKQYKLQIFQPYQLGDKDSAYRCPIKIVGEGVPDGIDKIEIGGNDGFQSLSLALKAAAAMVESLNRNFLDGKLRLFDDSDADLHLS